MNSLLNNFKVSIKMTYFIFDPEGFGFSYKCSFAPPWVFTVNDQACGTFHNLHEL